MKSQRMVPLEDHKRLAEKHRRLRKAYVQQQRACEMWKQRALRTEHQVRLEMGADPDADRDRRLKAVPHA